MSEYPKLNSKKVSTLIEARVRFWLIDKKAAVPDPRFLNEAGAITQSGVILLSATIQAFMERVFIECREKVYGKESIPERLSNEKGQCPIWGNPSDENINRLFALLEINDPMENFPQQFGLKEKFSVTLRNINQVRNRIAHGEEPRIDGVTFNLNLSILRQWLRASEICCPAFRLFVLRSSGLKPYMARNP